MAILVVEIDTSQAKEGGRIFAKVTQKMGKDAEEAAKKVDKVSAAMTKKRAAAARAENQVVKLIKQLGPGAGLAGALFVTGRQIQASIRRLAEFETGLVAVGKAADLSGVELKAFGTEIRDLANTVPATTKDLLELAAASAQVGVASKDLAQFTRIMEELQRATDVQGSEGVLQVTRVLNITGEGVRNADQFTNILVRLGNEAAATEKEILATVTRVAQGTAAFKVSSKEALQLATTMKELGFRSELSGSVVGRTFNRINAIVAEGGVALEKLARVTRSSTDELVRLRSQGDLYEVFVRLVQGLKIGEQAGSDMTVALTDLGLTGGELTSVISTLANRNELLAKNTKLATDEMANMEARSKEAATAAKTFDSQMEIFFNRVKRNIDYVLEPFKIVLQEIVTALNDAAAAADKAQVALPNPTAPGISSNPIYVPTALSSDHYIPRVSGGPGDAAFFQNALDSYLADRGIPSNRIRGSGVLSSNAIAARRRPGYGTLGGGAGIGIPGQAAGLSVVRQLEQHTRALERQDYFGELLFQAGEIGREIEGWAVQPALKAIQSSWTSFFAGLRRQAEAVDPELRYSQQGPPGYLAGYPTSEEFRAEANRLAAARAGGLTPGFATTAISNQRQGEIDTRQIEQAADAVRELGFGLGEASYQADLMSAGLESLGEVGATAIDGIADAFARSIVEGEKLSDTMRALAKDLTRLALKEVLGIAIRGVLGAAAGGAAGAGGGSGGAGGNARGNVLLRRGIVPMASGGVVDKPSFLPYAGEAGPEAVIPLKRGKDGKLGVQGGGGVVVNQRIVINTADADSFRRNKRMLTDTMRQLSNPGNAYGRNT